MNSVLIIPFEGLRPLSEIPSLGFTTILGNCILTFLLNLSAVYLIGLSSYAQLALRVQMALLTHQITQDGPQPE